MPCPICDNDAPNCDCTPEERRMHEKAEELLDRVAALEAAAPRWIPVAERLPEEGRLVLWCRSDERWPVTAGRFELPHHVDWGGDLCVPFSEGRYTHWMPLPPPPKS